MQSLRAPRCRPAAPTPPSTSGRAATPPHRQPLPVFFFSRAATSPAAAEAEASRNRRPVVDGAVGTAASATTTSSARRRAAIVVRRASSSSHQGAADDANSAAAANNEKASTQDAAFLMDFLGSCPPRVAAALKAIAADPKGALRQYARDPEVMAALGTALSRGMSPGRRAALDRLLAPTAEAADQRAAAGERGATGEASSSSQQQQQQQQQQQDSPAPLGDNIPAPGKVVSAMFSDPELARLMAEPKVKAALSAARAALLSGGGDAAAQRALQGRGPEVDRAMELLEARLGRFVAAPKGTVDV